MSIYFDSIDNNMTYNKYNGQLEFKVGEYQSYTLEAPSMTKAPEMHYIIKKDDSVFDEEETE